MESEFKVYDLVILGAGAAGLMSAITAGKRGKNVLILEKSNKIGKKILMSGGGKSNFTNLHVEPKNFISKNSHFCISALNLFFLNSLIIFFSENMLKSPSGFLSLILLSNNAINSILAQIIEN